MVTITKIGEEYNSQILEISGLSTDPKPVGQIDGVSIANGSTFKEIDTGKEYTYNESAETWHINKSASSGGGGGVDGEDGGYYTPGVTQPTTDTMQISFAPSKSDMPAVNPVTVNLPVSENSGQNVNPVTKTEDMTQPVGVDENGQLWTSHTTSSGSGGGGISVTSINLLIDILKVGMFTTNVSGKIDALKEALLAGSSGGSGGSGEDSGGNTGGGETVTDDITVSNGIMTIVSVGSAITVSDGIMSIA